MYQLFTQGRRTTGEAECHGLFEGVLFFGAEKLEDLVFELPVDVATGIIPGQSQQGFTFFDDIWR